MSLVVAEQGQTIVSAGPGRRMSDETRARLIASIPENTARSYRTQSAAFRAWCEREGWPELPTTGDALAEYADHLTQEGKAPGSIDVALSVIRTMHREAGLEVPDTRAARRIVRAYRRDRADAGVRDHQAPPAVAAHIRAMLDALPVAAAGDEPHPRVLRDRLLLLVGFGLMGRRSELSRLDIGDVTVSADAKDLVVRIGRSKTDQAATGTTTVVLAGRTEDACPVVAVRAWVARLAELGITDGPLLRQIDRHGNVGGRLGGQSIDRIVKRLGEAAGLGEALSAHSLRSGAATSAADAGATRAAIADQGRWNPTSNALDRYTRQADQRRNNALLQVVI